MCNTMCATRHALLGCVLLLLGGPRCHGYRVFQDRIPNGANVPHPCREGDTWVGVGHKNEGGGGERNAFGLDFHANGKRWDRTLCMKDSDGDGLTNGQELGDPDCVWEPGKTPARTAELSHPGVCDPWNSLECKGKTGFVTCENTFKCPVIKEESTRNFTVFMPDRTPVPARETTYMCVVFDFPTDQDYHLVANEPLIDNVDVMHHTLVFGCDHDNTKHAPGVPFECQMEVDPACPNIVAIWSFGMRGTCEHQDMGFRIGNNGFRRGILQHHWNNPFNREDFVDSSGMKLYLSSKLRMHDASILMVGQEYMLIPPQEQEVTTTGVCSSDCSRGLIQKEIKVPTILNHMHALGRMMLVEQFRNESKVRDMAYDPKYDYNTPELHIHDPPINILPGDELRTTCRFNSMDRQRTTFYGDGTFDEMCYAFITYYPKENIQDTPMCTAWKEVTLCAFNMSDVIQGCRFKELHDPTIPSMKVTYDKVMDNCSPLIGCRKECLPVVRRLKQTACYRDGTVNDWARLHLEEESPVPLKMIQFYAALDSCDVELAQEAARAQCPKPELVQGDNTNGVVALFPSNVVLYAVLAAIFASQQIR